jgi:biopolymer transport protein ExbD
MQVPRLLRTGEASINMTPMIDVVFQLIIFFLVSSHLAKQEVQLKLPLPEAASGEQETDPNAPRLTVNVLEDGSLLLAGRTIRAAEVRQRLRERIGELGPDVEVRIRSHRDVPYESVEPLLVACAKAGVWNVTFAVYEDAASKARGRP